MLNAACISSKRVYLRPFNNDDVDAIYSYRSLESIAKYQYWEPYTKNDAVTFIEKNAGTSLEDRNVWIGLAIIGIDNGDLIGDCALRVGELDVEIGCNISPKYQQNGYAKEVISLLCSYIFANTTIGEIFAITDSQNIASVNLLTSIGFVKVEGFEEKLMCKGVLSTEHKYAIKREDWVI